MRGKGVASVARPALIFVLVFVIHACTINPGIAKKPVSLEAEPEKPERTPLYHHGEWLIARGSIHNHTVYSDGCRTPEDLLELARRQGMAVLAITDHREGKICMGKGKLLCVNAGGVESAGYDEYYRHLAKIDELAKEKGMILLEGVEVSSPYFYNNGKFPHLVLIGQNRHFTVYGIQDPEILAKMPARRNIESVKPEKDPGDKPYQEFVDYITAHDGIVHVVHPESEQDEWMLTFHVVTPAPIHNLLLKNLTGFSVLPEGWHEKVGGPGGLWDVALLEYLGGLRPRPLWANADADYHGPEGSLANATTLFYMREFTEEEVYRCMKEGRMVALQGDAFQDSYVSEWMASNSPDDSGKVMLGEEVRLKGTPIIRFSLNRPVPETRTRLIRNGRVVYEVEGTKLVFADREQGKKKEPAFYRVEVIGPRREGAPYKDPTMPESELFVNPLFVRFGD